MTRALPSIAAVAVLLLSSGCARYESTVASRSVAGYAKAAPDRGMVGVRYTVTYR